MFRSTPNAILPNKYVLHYYDLMKTKQMQKIEDVLKKKETFKISD